MISLNDTIFDFSFDHGAIGKEGLLDIQEYLMEKNKAKYSNV